MTNKAVLRLIIACAAGAGAFLLFLGPSISYGVETESVVFDPAVTPERRSEPLIVGANIHYGLRRILGYTSAQTGLEQLASINATSYRDYLPWASYRYENGETSLVYSQRLMNLFMPQAKGLLPVLNLGMMNGHIPGGAPPVSDEALVDFKSYVRKAVSQTIQYDPFYEIWNEWNLVTGRNPPEPRLKGEGTPDDPRAPVHYLRIARAAIEAARSASPEARILVGAVGDDPGWLWAKAIVERGALEGADGFSVHVYNHCMKPRDRNAREMVERIHNLQTVLKSVRGVETPIYITEYGWTTGGKCGLTLDAAAYNFAQFILQIAQTDWVKGIWMHELKNITPDPDDMESNFGLFTFQNDTKPAACFVSEATAIVHQSEYIDVRQPLPDVFVARAKLKDRQKIILWTSTDFVTASYDFAGKVAAGKKMCGEGAVPPTGPVKLGPQPVVYDLEPGVPVEVKVTG